MRSFQILAYSLLSFFLIANGAKADQLACDAQFGDRVSVFRQPEGYQKTNSIFISDDKPSEIFLSENGDELTAVGNSSNKSFERKTGLPLIGVNHARYRLSPFTADLEKKGLNVHLGPTASYFLATEGQVLKEGLTDDEKAVFLLSKSLSPSGREIFIFSLWDVSTLAVSLGRTISPKRVELDSKVAIGRIKISSDRQTLLGLTSPQKNKSQNNRGVGKPQPKVINVWSTYNGKILGALPVEGTANILDYIFSIDTNEVLILTDRGILVWDFKSGKLRTTYHSKSKLQGRIFMSADGSRVMAADDSDQTIIWDLRSWRRIQTLPGQIIHLSREDLLFTVTREGRFDSILNIWELPPRK